MLLSPERERILAPAFEYAFLVPRFMFAQSTCENDEEYRRFPVILVSLGRSAPKQSAQHCLNFTYQFLYKGSINENAEALRRSRILLGIQTVYPSEI